MLNEQLQKDIDLEAKAEAKKMTARVSIFRHGYEAGWYDSGEKYAALWQAAEEKVQRYEKLLTQLKKYVINCRKYLTEPDGSKILQVIDEALTPKTGEDEKA